MRRAARKRTTRQLEQVFKALQGDHSHPFAPEIYRRRSSLPSSLASKGAAGVERRGSRSRDAGTKDGA